jgi:alcohol dehydrogenase
VNLARGSHAEVVVGMGGVRVLSVAKCIAMVAPGSSEMDDYLSGMQPAGEPLPYMAVPTTCRDPFLLSDEYLVTDARDRVARIGRTQKGITRIALFDPKLCSSLPAKYSATTLMDTLLAAIEGFISSKANFLSDTFLQQAIQLIGKTLNLAVEQPDDLKTRMNASTAGLLLALGLTMSRPGIGSALAYAINGRFMVPKSWVATILLPHVLEFNLTAASEKLAVVARMLGEGAEEADPVKAASRGVEVVRRFIGTLGLATRLRDFDLKLDDMVDIAGTARSYDMMNFLPRSISTEDLYDLIKTAF